MWYDIVPVNGPYRGIGRSLLATDLYSKRFKEKYDVLLNMYFDYISEILLQPTKEGFEKIVEICKVFNKHDILCEVIVYGPEQHRTFYGYELKCLGIDVVHEFCESLISEIKHTTVPQHFNGNGLLESETDAHNIVQYLDHGNVEWVPCYVHEIIGKAD